MEEASEETGSMGESVLARQGQEKSRKGVIRPHLFSRVCRSEFVNEDRVSSKLSLISNEPILIGERAQKVPHLLVSLSLTIIYDTNMKLRAANLICRNTRIDC